MIKKSFAASLVFAIAAVPALAADDKSPTDTKSPSTTASTQSQGRQITLTGKIVDLHEFFTGQKDSSSKYDSSKPDATIKSDATRPGASATDSSATRPGASDASSSAKAHMKGHQQYMALTNPALGTATGATGADATGIRAGSVNVTSSDVIILCFADAPSVFAVPRSDDRPSTTPGADRPSTTPGTSTTDRSSADKDHGQWKDKNVQVSGTLYEKGGMKFLLVSRVSSGSDTGSSTQPKTGTGTGTDRDNK